MKNHNEMYQSLLSRYDEYLEAKNKRKRIIKRVVPAVACFCFVSAAGIGYWRYNQKLPVIPPDTVIDDTSATSTVSSTVTAAVTSSKSNTVSTSADIRVTSTEVKVSVSVSTSARKTTTISETTYIAVSDDTTARKQETKTEPANTSSAPRQTATTTLSTAVKTSSQGVFVTATAVATSSNVTGDDNGLIHTRPQNITTGTTVTAGGIEDNNSLLRDKLEQLLKDGEYLQYGEALYTTGTPDGEKWAEELYRQRVDFYGKEFLEKYIVDGKFLIEKVEADLESLSSDSVITTADRSSDDDAGDNVFVSEEAVQPINEKYNIAFVDGYNGMYVNAFGISPDNVGEYVGTAGMRGLSVPVYDAEAYRIKNVSDLMALAIKFEGDDGYYLYRNSMTSIETIKEQISLKE